MTEAGSGADVWRGRRLGTGPSLWPPLPLATGLSHFLSGCCRYSPTCPRAEWLQGVGFTLGHEREQTLVVEAASSLGTPEAVKHDV